MANKALIAIITEGEYEKKVINKIKEVFFNKRLGKQNYLILTLPTAQNIYTLWQKVQEDRFVDIIELVRETSDENRRRLADYDRGAFSEVYLFYDYDKHQNNLRQGVIPSTVLEQMLTTFDNETELGKLYIGYPMAEAVNDFKLDSCETYTDSCYHRNTPDSYKSATRSNDNPMSHVGRLTYNKWVAMIRVYCCRLSCLQKSAQVLSLADCKTFSPLAVYRLQSEHESYEGTYIVLSAFPEFLIDYFPAEEFVDVEGNAVSEYRFVYDCERIKQK